MTARAAFLLVVLFPAAALAQGGDDEKMTVDPVCLMNINKESAPYSETFQGVTYYFCNQNCFKSFKETPDKFTGSVAYVRPSVVGKGSYRVKYMIRHGKIYAKSPSQIVFIVERNGAFKDAVSWKPASMEAKWEAKYDVGGGKTQTVDNTFKMTALKEPGCFAGTPTFAYPGYLSLRVSIRWDDGKVDEAEFKMPILPGHDTETGNEFDGQRMDMIRQHEIMKRMGKHWTATGEALRTGSKEGVETAKKELVILKGYQKYIKDMVPHVFEDELDEFKKVGEAYGTALGELDGMLNSGDAAKALDGWKRIDALHCTECHMKFRWSVFQDLKNYPVIEEAK